MSSNYVQSVNMVPVKIQLLLSVTAKSTGEWTVAHVLNGCCFYKGLHVSGHDRLVKLIVKDTIHKDQHTTVELSWFYHNTSDETRLNTLLMLWLWARFEHCICSWGWLLFWSVFRNLLFFQIAEISAIAWSRASTLSVQANYFLGHVEEV